MKIIEVLYPEFSHIYAENFNIEYLKKSNKNIKVIYTNYKEEPYFINNDVDMIYIGSMPDNLIEICIKKLIKYKNKIKELIENDTLFLLTGNSLEIFSSYIIEKNKKIKGLDIFDYYIEKDMNNRHNSWFIGDFLDMEIIGHRNQFSRCLNNKNEFIKVTGGLGMDFEGKKEGINYKNFFATYIHGPLLIMNPKFAKFILRKLKLDDKLIYEQDFMEAYEDRRNTLKRQERFTMGDHG